MTDVTERRCAVIFNPVKVSDGFREAMAERVAAAKWTEPVWSAFRRAAGSLIASCSTESACPRPSFQ